MNRMLRAGTLLALAIPMGTAGLAAPAAGRPAAQAAAAEIESAVGLTRTRVRVRFAEPVAARTVDAGDLVLTMGGQARTVSAVVLAADGQTAELEARPRWPYGTAGAIRLRTAEKAVRVWAAPGDLTPPVLRDVRLSKRVVCTRNGSRNCPTSGGNVNYTVDEAVTIVLDLRRRSTDAPSLMRVTSRAGRRSVRFGEKIEGRRLRPGSFRLTVKAVDAAGNASRSFTLSLRVRR